MSEDKETMSDEPKKVGTGAADRSFERRTA